MQQEICAIYATEHMAKFIPRRVLKNTKAIKMSETSIAYGENCKSVCPNVIDVVFQVSLDMMVQVKRAAKEIKSAQRSKFGSSSFYARK